MFSLSIQNLAGVYLVLSSLGMERRLKQTTPPLPLAQSTYKNTRRRCEICSKLTNKNTWRQCCRSGVFIVNFEHILHLFLYLFLNRHVVAFYKTSVLRKVCILPYLYKQCWCWSFKIKLLDILLVKFSEWVFLRIYSFSYYHCAIFLIIIEFFKKNSEPLHEHVFH